VLTFAEKLQKSGLLINFCKLLLYVQHFSHMENTLHANKLLTTLTHDIITFESICFTKTLLFCANFLRKMVKVKISDYLL
jgi:hypothetical protein